jgi:hypothetical protein
LAQDFRVTELSKLPAPRPALTGIIRIVEIGRLRAMGLAKLDQRGRRGGAAVFEMRATITGIILTSLTSRRANAVQVERIGTGIC